MKKKGIINFVGQNNSGKSPGSVRTGPLNKEQAVMLFDKYAILLNTFDAVPEETVARLFGDEAVEFVERMDKTERGNLRGLYGNGKHTISFITLKGFLKAVTYYNINRLFMECDIKEYLEEETL